ncbi:NADH-quinone oxidoreductase subunit NuoE family protein [Sporomusa ovata]|uniref:NAD-reducing hydrogenase subunit HoxE n=1 Tax=Sporomusa ovata TaxID=2378 RepID=A0A0U1KU27_9FIRM|nr:NAD(P)H-dependent oxidoreductase subunit E [Sporomusa ovata]CQR70897.1 NAD-reducing hydrogenase subunit HoxE [Sporomusa ovata]
MMPTNLEEWEQLPESDKQLINILNQIQEEQGYIPHDRLTELARQAGVPESQLHGLVSFSNFFRSRPAGKHKLSVCYGTACYARGASLLNDRLVAELKLEDGEDTSADGFVTVDHVYCVGACSRAPLVVVDGQINGKIKSYQVPLLLEDLRKKG